MNKHCYHRIFHLSLFKVANNLLTIRFTGDTEPNFQVLFKYFYYWSNYRSLGKGNVFYILTMINLSFIWISIKRTPICQRYFFGWSKELYRTTCTTLIDVFNENRSNLITFELGITRIMDNKLYGQISLLLKTLDENLITKCILIRVLPYFKA